MKNAYLDTETFLIGPGALAPPLVCVQVAIEDGPVAVIVNKHDETEEILRDLLTYYRIVGHNVAYDMLVIMREFPALTDLILDAYEDDRVTCTIVREKLLLIKKGRMRRGLNFSLAALAKKYGDVKNPNDPWRLRYSELIGIPFEDWPPEAQQYAVHDVEATRLVYQSQGPAEPDEYRQARAAMTMHVIGANGVNTDPAAVAEFEKITEREYLEDQQVLITNGLVRTDGTKDTKKAKDRMTTVCESLDLSVKRTKKGGVSLDEESCDRAGDPVLSAYQRYGSRKNLLSRLQGLKKGFDTPINPRFDSLLETGRTSCTKGAAGGPTNGYQIQNMRRAVGERECFVPRPGNVFVACDYDSFELVTLAQVCLWVLGRSALAEAIRDGLDPHLAMAAKALGEQYSDVLAIYKDPNHPRHEAVTEARQGSKIANFGYPGGMGANSFVQYARGYGMDLTSQQADELKENWLQTWPEMVDYFRWVNAHSWVPIRRGDYVMDMTTITQLRSQRVRGAVSYTVACNSFFQGLAADAAKSAGWALLRACERGSLQGWEMWNFVHDEYLLQGPEEDVDRAAKIVKDIMVDAAQEWLPDVPVSASPCAMRRWSKKAKPVIKDDKLVPWEDA